MAEAVERQLIWAPVIHTESDMGSIRQRVRILFKEKWGEQGWQRHVRAVEQIWNHIWCQVLQLDLDYSRLRLYQDGLPVCGREIEIVEELARAGSQNHLLLVELMKKGARLMGTESPELLLDEYKLIHGMLEMSQSQNADLMRRRFADASQALLQMRDRFVAQRIEQTLLAGETGLIFLGVSHAIDEFLPADIDVVTLNEAVRRLRSAE